MARSNCETSTPRVVEHYERRRADGENARSFFLREEHLQFLRRYKIANGLPSLNAALQSVLERDNSFKIEEMGNPQPRQRNPKTRDGT